MTDKELLTSLLKELNLFLDRIDRAMESFQISLRILENERRNHGSKNISA